MTLYISSAARELKEMLADKDRDFNEYAQRIKGLEHACDELTHNIPLASTGRSSLPLIAKTFT